jgi:kumamolisin
VELRGSRRDPLAGFRDLGPWEKGGRISVTVLLRRRPDSEGGPFAADLGRRRPSGRTRLSRAELAERFGAHPDDLAALAAFAEHHGLEVLGSSVGGRTVRLAGPSDALARLFGVRLRRWSDGHREYRGRTGAVHLPRELEAVVLGVFGLDDRPQARPRCVRHRVTTPEDASYTPLQVAAAYDFPAGTDGTGQTIAVLELGGGFAASDLATYFAGLGLPTPAVTVVSVDEASNSPTGDPDGPDGEVTLDLEIAGAVAPGARLVAYFAPNTDQGFLDGLTAAVHDTTHHPQVISVSWGGPESSWTSQAMEALSGVCEDAAALGVTILVASGDQGATDGLPAGELAVDFPASSPYALGCGGTRLLLSPQRSETVWNEEAIGEGATGGGISVVFARPDYQSAAEVPAAPSGFVGRGVPDVAGDADPATGYRIFVAGRAEVFGGTSAVAPLWGALVARFNQALGAPVGFVNPDLYEPAGSATFHAITSGNNDGYSAGPGWNPCTGWGSPDGARLLTVLRALPPS